MGTALIADARRRLVDRGFTAALLWVLTGNVRAEHFYRRDGWRPDGSCRVLEVHGIGADETRYRRDLMTPLAF